MLEEVMKKNNRNQAQGSSYASKVSPRASKQRPEDAKAMRDETEEVTSSDQAVAGERLLVSVSEQESAADTSPSLAEDAPAEEVAAASEDPGPQQHHYGQQQQFGYGMVPGGHGLGYPGYYNHGYVPPPQVYSPGSPPLPLTGPLQLVYLQPTAHGAVNIIPFQATGHPTFSPGSPLGFPAHPHHPVVVQTPQPFITSSPGYPGPYDPSMMMYPGYMMAAGQYPHQDQAAAAPSPAAYRPPRTKLFRPWEDKIEEETAKKPFVEDDFPALQSGLTKLNLR